MCELISDVVIRIHLELMLKIINHDDYSRPEMKMGEGRIDSLVEGMPFLLRRIEPSGDVVP